MYKNSVYVMSLVRVEAILIVLVWVIQERPRKHYGQILIRIIDGLLLVCDSYFPITSVC